jgi:hypothetical protein
MFKEFIKRAGVQHTYEMYKRTIIRSLFLMAFTAASFFTLEYLVQEGRYGNDINQRFPEFLIILRALAIYTWIEVSIFWIRITLESKTDVQKASNKAEESPIGAAIAYGIHTFKWLARMLIICKLADLF